MPQVIMPKMGDGMEEGTLLKWLKAEGDEVSEGDAIAEIETDKVSLEIEATESGKISRLLVGEGDVVPIGQAIAQIGDDDLVDGASEPTAEVISAPGTESESIKYPDRTTGDDPTTPDSPSTEGFPAGVAAQTSETTRPAAAEQPATETTSNGRFRASPLVKRLAAEHGIDLQQVQGSGPGGRIVKDDVMPYVTGARTQAPRQAAPAAAPAPAPAAATPAPQAEATPAIQSQTATGPATYSGRPAPVLRELPRIRRVTGRRMTESKQTVPHFYVTSEIDMAAAAEFRTQINSQLPEGGARVSFNDLVVKAAALALTQHPDLNASFEGGELYDHSNVDINIAVALDGGLIAPFIADADQKSLGAIARASKDLIGRAKNGGLKPEEYQGGTFTISNLGMLDVDEFIAVINPPQAAILAVGAIARVPVVQGDQIVIGQRMKLSVSADHRAVDGAEVARFLQTVRGYLEKPMTLALG
ncbi:MAG TPA: dihydrolipoamide acetyltransferase family protein [Thermomicrobiales bacterium]|jgi:pyruvate dehydrogenase E2 component (dihydrolipoamide acetyltransferase)|nr:dihydrolipoamide acetyltransferase family protein [Thermomicrobiales bacterium]